jgi:hypothetical protein
MTRKLSVLFVLAFFVMSLGSVAFAANAAKAKPAAQSKSFVSDASGLKSRMLSDNEGSGAPTFGKPTTAWPTTLGYYMINEVQVGSTEFDWQSNDSQQRQVVMGSDNKIHTVWINATLVWTCRSSLGLLYRIYGWRWYRTSLGLSRRYPVVAVTVP